jgi:hypothetical protein
MGQKKERNLNCTPISKVMSRHFTEENMQMANGLYKRRLISLGIRDIKLK